MFFTLLAFVVVTVLNELLRPKPQIENQRPRGLGDFSFPTATEGRVIPLIWGTVRLSGPNVVWYGDLEQFALVKKFKTGMFSSQRAIVGFRYYLGVQMALCRGPGCVLRRVWIGDDEVWSGTVGSDGGTFDIDKPDLFGGETNGSGGVMARCDFYTGSDSQPVNAYLDDANRQRITSAATPIAPTYTGTCYIVARWLPTDTVYGSHDGCYLGNATTIKPWSFELQRLPALFPGQTGTQNRVGDWDANPVNVVYELLTNTEWGYGEAAADIDAVNFKAAADTLRTEGCGFSMIQDRPVKAREFLAELQRQMDGIVFRDQETGKWQIRLARADYTLGTLPVLNESNVVSVTEFVRGSWEDTTNQIQVQLTKRADDYRETYALAQDMANAMIRGGGSPATANVSDGQANYPGVMDSTLGSNLAWRDLRAQSYPLARMKLEVNRSVWDVKLGDVFRLSWSVLGIVDMPVRVSRISLGLLESNKITLNVVQDVFAFAAAAYADVPASNWTSPTPVLEAYPSNRQIAMEAPRALVVRDPEYAGDPFVARIFAAARRQAGESGFVITQRNGSTPPAGPYLDDGEVFQFVRVGELKTALAAGVANPTTLIDLTPSPDGQAALESVFNDGASVADLGADLQHLLLVGEEFMLAGTANVTGSDVRLQSVFRGALDSVQGSHAAGAPVYLLFLGAGLGDSNITNTHLVDVQLRPRSLSEVFSGSVTTIAFQMAKRAMRPYPPNAPLYSGSSTPFGTYATEGDGSGLNGLGTNVGWRRRRFDTTNEAEELLADFAPDASTEYRVRIYVDPAGINTEILPGPSAWTTSPVFINRLYLWELAPAGTLIRVAIEARHDIGTETGLVSRYAMLHDVTPTGAMDGKFYLGGNMSATQATNAYTAAATGTYVVNIGASYASSQVQYRLNGGSWTTTIAAGGTTGNIAGVVPGDTIELRHTVNQAPDPNFIELRDPSSVVVAYGTLSA